MTNDEKLKLDRQDLQRICDGLETYIKLDAKGMMERLKAHREDAFCSVSNYAADGDVLCTRDGYNAIIQLAARHRESLPVPDDYSVNELVEGIRKHVVRAIIDEEADTAAERVLLEATNDARQNHIERTYHFPCVIVAFDEPAQFRVGQVTFTAAKSFSCLFQQEFQLYVRETSNQKFAEERVRIFQEYISKFGWVATVCIPPCAKEAAKSRAEESVTTAINLLRLVFGVHYGRDMRVAHLAFAQPFNTEYAITKNGKFEIVSSRTFAGALVEKDWYLQMQNWQGFWSLSAHLIEAIIAGKRSEISYRVEDALTWFGESAFESAPGKQIVNLVAALERITTTESFSTHKFCSRVAILAHDDDTDFEKAYWSAYAIHSARSQVIHGGFSPRNATFVKALRLAHDLTRNALFRGLEVHSYLDHKGRLSNLEDLQNFFTEQHSKWAPVLKKLSIEMKVKKGARQEISSESPGLCGRGK